MTLNPSLSPRPPHHTPDFPGIRFSILALEKWPLQLWSSRNWASSWIRSSMVFFPIPKFLKTVRENRRSCFQRSPLENTTPKEKRTMWKTSQERQRQLDILTVRTMKVSSGKLSESLAVFDSPAKEALSDVTREAFLLKHKMQRLLDFLDPENMVDCKPKHSSVQNQQGNSSNHYVVQI
ncbi:hypothetical protein JRQ81_011976 [Phrynocephalus forsythii]|uniref:Uncharacterized protein n=1 Tax=Phrynocephalus forsythii TaxID=171643 RepID=A0A9Q0X8S4_9SAUR|nr:hypothetical protein JRQ81_011976 [Phrynocephalus forsythii]